MNFQGFIDILPVMGKGMLGVFIVTGAIILSIYILNKLTKKRIKENDCEEKTDENK